MLTKKTPETISAALTITGQGITDKFNVTFRNLATGDMPKGDAVTVGDILLAIVKDWETEYPVSAGGITAMEEDRPGILYAIVEAYYRARRVELEKN